MSSSRSFLSLGLSKELFTALTRNGYETLQDLDSSTPELLSKELNIPLPEVEHLFARHSSSAPNATGAPNGPASQMMTQSAASMVQNSQKISTRCEALDTILEGGLPRGHVLEISGPPGSPKEMLAMNVVTSFVDAGEGVLFVDCQHMTTPSDLRRRLKDSDTHKLVHYTTIQDLAELFVFLHQLPGILHSNSNVSLLVINSISFPFQIPSISLSERNTHLERVKQALSKASASQNLTTVTTSQLATKMVNADGSPGTFDSGATGIMLPQLGPTYLPNGKAHRVILSLDGLTSGNIKLLSSPKYSLGRVPLIMEPYSIVDGNIA